VFFTKFFNIIQIKQNFIITFLITQRFSTNPKAHRTLYIWLMKRLAASIAYHFDGLTLTV